MSRSVNGLIRVAIGIILNTKQEVLVALRPENNPHGGLWEFPGGKFEESETPLDALTRELYEEVGVKVNTAVPLLCVEHDYGIIRVELNTWHVESYSGTPYSRENQRIQWVNASELSTLSFPAGNRLIVEKVTDMLQNQAPPV